MGIFRNDMLGSWTRRGQAIVYNVRMTTQVFYQTMLAGFIIWILGTLWYAFEKPTEYERFVLVKLAEATIKVGAAGGTNDPIQFVPGLSGALHHFCAFEEADAAACEAFCHPPPSARKTLI